MRKVIIMFALAMGIATAHAQENVTVETNNGREQPTLTKEVYPQQEVDGDLYHGLSRKLTFDRMIPPHGLEAVSYTHLDVYKRQAERGAETAYRGRGLEGSFFGEHG